MKQYMKDGMNEQKNSIIQTKYIIGAVIIFVLVYYFAFSGNINNHYSSNNQTTTQAPTIAQKMATLDYGGNECLGINNDKTIDIQQYLTSLSNIYGESEESIANCTYKATQVLANKGLTYSNIALLRIVDRDNNMMQKSGVKYAEVLAYITTATTK